MPTYKVYYFNAKGRAELTRWIFAQAGVPYEDIRIEGPKWPEVKPTMPFGKMPVLDVDGTRLAGSSVIARYVAEEYGLAGSNSLENSQVASIVDAVNDLFTELLKVHFQEDGEKKDEMKKVFSEQTLPAGLAKFEALGSTNDKGYLWGSKLTWADLAFANFITWIMSKAPEILCKYPALKKLKETVDSLPNIAKWLKERPETEH